MSEQTSENDALREALSRLHKTSDLGGYRIVVEAFALCGRPRGHDGGHRTGTAGWAGWPCAEVVVPSETRCCTSHHFEGCTDGSPGCCARCPINPTDDEGASA